MSVSVKQNRFWLIVKRFLAVTKKIYVSIQKLKNGTSMHSNRFSFSFLIDKAPLLSISIISASMLIPISSKAKRLFQKDVHCNNQYRFLFSINRQLSSTDLIIKRQSSSLETSKPKISLREIAPNLPVHHQFRYWYLSRFLQYKFF